VGAWALLLAAACAQGQVHGLPDAVWGLRWAELQAPPPPAQPREVTVKERVLARLQGGPVPPAFVEAAFADPRLAIDPDVIARIGAPGEALPYERYRKIFMTEERIAAGAAFARAQKDLLERAAAPTGVDPLLLVALVGIETFYGRGTGRHVVFNALYTAADRIPARRAFADRELAEFLTLCHADGYDVFSIKGSYAGAFGYGQFIPSTFNNYALDFDGDGKRGYDSWPDVLASIASYLKRNGYSPDPAGTYRAIYAYNHHDNYVRVVLEMRAAVAARLP
jgi:membrane-bound lytic murein transglycosylase B